MEKSLKKPESEQSLQQAPLISAEPGFTSDGGDDLGTEGNISASPHDSKQAQKEKHGSLL